MCKIGSGVGLGGFETLVSIIKLGLVWELSIRLRIAEEVRLFKGFAGEVLLWVLGLKLN